MKQWKRSGIWQKGFTLTEVIIVMAIAGTLMVIAVPNFIEWRRNVQYRTVARDLASTLRYAQSSSVMNNRQYRVQFETPAFGRYRVQQGDRMTAGGWLLALDWHAVPLGMTLQPTNLTVNDSVDFNPNGTASNAPTIDIIATDATPSLRFRVQVENTGRITIVKP